MAYPVLKHAPITEAVVDIKTDSEVLDAKAAFDAFGAWASKEYGEPQPILEQTFEIENGRSKGVTTNDLGRIYWNKDRDRAVQARVDGFTFNILKHYREWAEHRAQARAAWDEYRRVMPLRGVRRCALRYLNRITLSSDKNVSDYLRLYPLIPDEISSELQEFAMRTVVALEGDRRANLAVKLSSPGDDGKGVLILDIDVFTNRQVGLDDELWVELDVLNGLAARCFFESLHTSVLESFK